MVSNEVVTLEPGEARPALLLTPKSRIVAPLRVVREGPESFLLITEADARRDRRARRCCARASRPSARSSSSRTAATCSSARARGSRNDDYGVEAFESWAEEEREAAEPERRSSACGSRRARPSGAASSTRRSSPPRPGSTRRTSRSRRAATRARSRSRGCTTAAARTGASPCSRSRRRAPATRSSSTEKTVGRVTSAVPGRALGYVRREVADDAELEIGGAAARLHLPSPRP